MNFFKSEGIILTIKKISEKESIYTIFFREYGKIHVKKQKKTREKNLDIGYRISGEIVTHNTSKNILPSISNIKILSFFQPEGKTYSDMNGYLSTLSYINKQLPEGLPHCEIYEIACFLHSQVELTHISYLLMRLKIRSYSGSIEVSKDEGTVYKIIRFVEQNSIEEILRLKHIPEEIEQKLETLL